jgi:thioester reductase-like protein
MTQAICHGTEVDAAEASYRTTKSLLAKYIQLIDEKMPRPTRSYQTKNKGDEVAVLTGATGSLGALVLQDLLQNTSVRKVYALVRGKDGIGRLNKAFSDRALDTELLKSDKLQIYPFDQAQQSLGLDGDQYRSIQAEATVICHCAWMLDFLQPVTYYEKECIKGLFNLLQLAYNNGSNSMRFHFISSVSASMSMKGEVLELPLPDDPSCAAPMGYAQSKFIAEHMVRYVTEKKSKSTGTI